MLPEVGVEFRITGQELPLSQTTEMLGLPPSRTWLKGESMQGTKRRWKNNGWCLALHQAQLTFDLEAAIRELLQVLQPRAAEITEMCRASGSECEMSCAVMMSDETPAINLRPETLGALARLNVTLDIDIIFTRT